MLSGGEREYSLAEIAQFYTEKRSKHHNEKKVTKKQRNKRNRIAKQSRRKNRK